MTVDLQFGTVAEGMGAFYSSIQVRSEDREAVKTALESITLDSGKKFLLGPALDGWIGIYPDGSGSDEHYTAMLATRLNTVVLHLMVHDSDIFLYGFFRNGKLLNEYSSNPDYFEEVSQDERERFTAKPEIFRELVASPEQFEKLVRLLDHSQSGLKFDFEEHRLEKFAAGLGIRNALTSYEYLTHGEHDGIKSWRDFVHIPDQSAEKTAKKAAQAAQVAEKQKLQKAGLLCVENLPSGKKQQRINSRGECCFDPVGGGLLVLWKTSLGVPQPAQWIRLQSPWASGPQPIPMTFSSTDPGELVMSATGKWLALFDGGLKLWDWHRQAPIDDLRHDGVPVEFSRDEKSLLCRGRGRFDLISLETRQVVKTLRTENPVTVQALHPSNNFLIIRPRDDQLGIINIESGELERLLLSGTRMDWSSLVPVFESSFEQAGLNKRDLDEWRSGFVQGSAHILNLRFSPDGRWLFCATTQGLRVLAWDQLLSATEATPRPMFAVMPHCQLEPGVLDNRYYSNFIYDAVLDERQNRLLFCGIEGTIRFLHLNDGSAGVLLDPPGKSPICRLQLSLDRKFISCLCCPPTEERHNQAWRIQVWNYPALCRAKGLGQGLS